MKIAKTSNRFIPTPSLPNNSVILGVDPGLARTGYGLVRHVETGKFELIEAAVIRTDTTMNTAERLAKIAEALKAKITQYQPKLAVIERVFINSNLGSSMALSQARGAAMAALGSSGITVAEIAPNSIKHNITGDNLASKAQVAKLVRALLKVDTQVRLAADATDALAAAVAYCATDRKYRLRRGRRRR